MTKNEAARLVSMLAAAFSHNLTTDELAIWFGSCLERCDAMVGGMVVQRIIAEDKFWPTPARFNELRRATERGLEEPVRALNEGPRTEQERANAAAVMSKVREVTNHKAYVHWHGGPDPCRVCGGLNPNPKERERFSGREG